MTIPPFAPKAWQDLPQTVTPINAAALQDLETRLSAYAALVVAPTVAAGVQSIYETSGTYALRNTVTRNVAQTVLWIGIDPPTIGGGYAINVVDIWIPTSV